MATRAEVELTNAQLDVLGGHNFEDREFVRFGFGERLRYTHMAGQMATFVNCRNCIIDFNDYSMRHYSGAPNTVTGFSFVNCREMRIVGDYTEGFRQAIAMWETLPYPYGSTLGRHVINGLHGSAHWHLIYAQGRGITVARNHAHGGGVGFPGHAKGIEVVGDDAVIIDNIVDELEKNQLPTDGKPAEICAIGWSGNRVRVQRNVVRQRGEPQPNTYGLWGSEGDDGRVFGNIVEGYEYGITGDGSGIIRGPMPVNCTHPYSMSPGWTVELA